MLVNKCRQDIIQCGDIFGTHLPLSVSCIGLTKGVPKFGITFGQGSCNVDMHSAKHY